MIKSVNEWMDNEILEIIKGCTLHLTQLHPTSVSLTPRDAALRYRRNICTRFYFRGGYLSKTPNPHLGVLELLSILFLVMSNQKESLASKSGG